MGSLMNITEFFENIATLQRVKRCIRIPHFGDYNVMTHSYIGTMFVWIIGEELMNDGHKLHLDSAIKMFLIHDLPEYITNDIPYHSKEYMRKEFNINWEEMEFDLIEKDWENVSSISGPIIQLLKKYIAGEDKAFEGNNITEREKNLVRLADTLEFLRWVHEQYIVGNRHHKLWDFAYTAWKLIHKNPIYEISKITEGLCEVYLKPFSEGIKMKIMQEV